jgi:hypothetical protein
MSGFEYYLQQYEIDAITLAIAAQIRYLTAWNAQQGDPIPSEDVQKIRAAVLALTGVAYPSSLNVLQEKQQRLIDWSLCSRLIAKRKKRGIYRDGRIINALRGCSYSSSRWDNGTSMGEKRALEAVVLSQSEKRQSVRITRETLHKVLGEAENQEEGKHDTDFTRN